MVPGKIKYQKGLLSKWLVTLTIVLSLFSFSGPSGFSPVHPEKATTEVGYVHHGTLKLNHLQLAFHQGTDAVLTVFPASFDWLTAVLACNTRIKLLQNALFSQFLSFKSIFQYHQRKTLPAGAENNCLSLLS